MTFGGDGPAARGDSATGGVPLADAAPAGSLYLLSRKPERRRILGIEQRGKQPAVTLADGTNVSIY